MSGPFSFAPFSIDQFITSNDWYEPSTIQTEPLPPLEFKQQDNLTQRIAESLAGDRYYGVTGEDKSRALGNALMEMGGRLGAAAGAGSWTKAYPYLNQLIPSGYGAYNQSLKEDEQHRMAIKDRVDTLKLRELQMKKAEYEAGDLEREQASREELRAKAKENADKWRAMFNETVVDRDITEPERKSLTTNFEFSIQNYLAKPDDPNSINMVLDYVNKVGAAAGQTEKIDQKVANELHESWLKDAPNIPFEKYLDDQQKIYGLNLTKAQKDIALLDARIREANAGSKLAGSQADWYAAGRPGSGTAGSVTDSKQYTSILSALNDMSKNERFQYGMGDLMVEGITDEEIRDKLQKDPTTLSMIKSFLPKNEKGQIVISKASIQSVYDSIFDPVAREQFAARYATQGGGPAPGINTMQTAGVNAVGDPKSAIRVQKFLTQLQSKGYTTIDGKPLDRKSALAKLATMTPDQIARLDAELGL